MRRRTLAALLVAGVLGLAGALSARVPDVPFSPLRARRRVGPDWPVRRGVATAERPDGEMDDMDAYARDGFDPDDVHPAVRRFYERTAEYAMAFDVHWHRPFRLGAALAAPVTARLEQLNLPGPRTEDSGPWTLESAFRGIDPTADPREGARAWVRTDAETGDAVFVAVYGSHVTSTSGGERRDVNIAAPLPYANLSTVLRLDHFDGTDEGTGVELTTDASSGPGLYLVTPVGAFALPMDQRFRVWPADAPGAPAAPALPSGRRPALVATHEMWLLGRQFLTVTYGIAQTSTSTS